MVRDNREGVGHRQDNVRSVVLGLHQSSSAAAELHGQFAAVGMAERSIEGVGARAHAWAPSSLPSLRAARAARSSALATGSPT